MKKERIDEFLWLSFIAGLLWACFESTMLSIRNWDTPITSAMRFAALWKPFLLILLLIVFNIIHRKE